MGLGFFPNSVVMCKEIEQWTARGKLDTLLGLCNCCIYKTFDYILAQECRMCNVRKGIQEILTEKEEECPEGEELLNAS